MTPVTVDRSALILGAELGKGGEGRVYSVTAPKFGRPTAYKEYRSGAHIDRPALDRLLDLYAGFDRPRQKDWLERFAWPIQPVQNGSATTGFLMPEVPEHFFTDWLRGTTHTRRIAEFQHLLNTPDFITQRGITLTRRHQYQLLTHLAETLQLLHNHHLAVGDLSPKNLLFNLTEPTATVYLIDCDTITHRDNPRKHHVETPGWGLPTGPNNPEPLATPASDAYKFGLLALRLLAGSQNTTTPSALPDDAQTLRPLITRSLDPNPRHRPTPAEWIPTLRVAANRATRSPLPGGTERTRHRRDGEPDSELVVIDLDLVEDPLYTPAVRTTHDFSSPQPAASASRNAVAAAPGPPAADPVIAPTLPSELRARIGSPTAQAQNRNTLERSFRSYTKRVRSRQTAIRALWYASWLLFAMGIVIALIGTVRIYGFVALGCICAFVAKYLGSGGPTETEEQDARYTYLTLQALDSAEGIEDAALRFERSGDSDIVTAHLVIDQPVYTQHQYAQALAEVFGDLDIGVDESRIHLYAGTDGSPLP